jgi:excisionase family DNA binding protein
MGFETDRDVDIGDEIDHLIRAGHSNVAIARRLGLDVDHIAWRLDRRRRKLHRRSPKKRKPRTAGGFGMLTAAEAAAMLGVSAKLVYKLYHRGDLEGCKVAGAVRIHRASVEAYLAANSNRKPAAPVEVPAPQPTPRVKRRRRSSRSEGFRFLPPKG